MQQIANIRHDLAQDAGVEIAHVVFQQQAAHYVAPHLERLPAFGDTLPAQHQRPVEQRLRVQLIQQAGFAHAGFTTDEVSNAAGGWRVRFLGGHDDPLKLMAMHVKTRLPKLDDVTQQAAWVTPEMCALVDGALIKDPAHRFPSAEVMIQALDDAFYSIDHLDPL